jgi:hypothetical protein
MTGSFTVIPQGESTAVRRPPSSDGGRESRQTPPGQRPVLTALAVRAPWRRGVEAVMAVVAAVAVVAVPAVATSWPP